MTDQEVPEQSGPIEDMQYMAQKIDALEAKLDEIRVKAYSYHRGEHTRLMLTTSYLLEIQAIVDRDKEEG